MRPTWTKPLSYLSRDQVGPCFYSKQVYNVAKVEELEVQNLEYQKNEELYDDKDSEVFDTILLNGPIEFINKKIKILKDTGTDVHGIYRSYFHHFSIDQTLSFHEFVDWCHTSYSSSKRVIMDTSK